MISPTVVGVVGVVADVTNSTVSTRATSVSDDECSCTCRFYELDIELFGVVCDCANSSVTCQSFSCRHLYSQDYLDDYYQYDDEAYQDRNGNGTKPSLKDGKNSSLIGVGFALDDAFRMATCSCECLLSKHWDRATCSCFGLTMCEPGVWSCSLVPTDLLNTTAQPLRGIGLSSGS